MRWEGRNKRGRVAQAINCDELDSKLFSKTLTTYYVLNADSLRFLEDVNRVYGWALAVCIIVNLPSNAFFVIILSLERFRYPFKIMPED
ncbi:hypothetical protein TYRP_004883 [Tyrophagus putrescentiae]|nr:hypothetical protein TYRP_004883 [Tyrophagus putrescentiae]